jgi:NodT family efflux transporter outer membrane factor (OMF) lipoprotein
MNAWRSSVMTGFVIPALLSGCSMVGPNYLRPNVETPVAFKELPKQDGWRAAAPADGAPKGDWWAPFNDPQLDGLEKQVTLNNQTLKVSEANYREAQALMAEAGAAVWPSISGASGLSRARETTPIANSATANVTAGWTLDLWGKLRRGLEEQKASEEASAADLANAKLTEQAALATALFNLRETDAMRDLLARTVSEYEKSLAITQNQHAAGTVARSDVITAQAQLLSARVSLTNTGVARAQYEHAIATLIGKPPEDVSIPSRVLNGSVPKVPVSLPSTLLERRPDIASAERKMQAANAAIGVAVGAYYPDISLSGSYGVASNLVKAGNPVWSIGLSLAQTLFNGGLTAAQVNAAKASYDASVATYRQTVLTAFQQVDDQLATSRILAQQAGIEAQSVEVSRQALDIALNEYKAGTQNYTAVVTAQAQALLSQEQALATRNQRLQAAVSLIVALGGGWSPAEGSAGPQ